MDGGVSKEPMAIAEELIELTTALATERRVETLLAGVIGAARRLTHAEGGRILVLDRIGRELHCVCAENEENPAAADAPGAVALYRPDGGFNLTEPSAFAAITGRMVNIADLYAYTGFDFAAVHARDRAIGYRSRAFLVLPLRGPEGTTLGVLQLVNMRLAADGGVGGLAPEHERAVRSFAAHAAVAISNARLFEENRQLIRQLDRANTELSDENTLLRTAVERTSAGSAVIGDSAPLAAALDLARRAAGARVPVLLLGETGTGKEVFSRFVHQASERGRRPFVAQNCASLPETLLESELFGHRRGAFSGAVADKKGLTQEANGGTLFLDEIGDMPLDLQARLLRVLDERQVTPLGSEESQPVDFQLISGSHRNLPALVRAGQFREDLYYRLCGIELRLPALRERSDRSALIEAILAEEAGQPCPLTPTAHRALMSHPWPGNVRQLRHVLRTAVALADGTTIDLAHLPFLGRSTPPEAPPERPAGTPPAEEPVDLSGLNAIQTNERQVLLRLLEQHRWNMSKVAQALDVSRNTLYRKLHKLRIPVSQRV